VLALAMMTMWLAARSTRGGGAGTYQSLSEAEMQPVGLIVRQ